MWQGQQQRIHTVEYHRFRRRFVHARRPQLEMVFKSKEMRFTENIDRKLKPFSSKPTKQKDRHMGERTKSSNTVLSLV